MIRWVELRDLREMDSYTMSIASDPGNRRQHIPGDLARRYLGTTLIIHGHLSWVQFYSKLRYLTLELFGDLATYMFGTFEFYMTLAIYLFALWFRIYIHYLTGYLFLLVCRFLAGFD